MLSCPRVHILRSVLPRLFRCIRQYPLSIKGVWANTLLSRCVQAYTYADTMQITSCAFQQTAIDVSGYLKLGLSALIFVDGGNRTGSWNSSCIV